MISIENSRLRVKIHPLGAELKSVFHKEHNLEYIWQGNPAFWAKSSPVLFPTVGELKEKTYRYNGKSYQLSRHGFAREKEFAVRDQQENAVTFTLESSAETLAVYPFEFIFSITYTVDESSLRVRYSVTNRGGTAMLFSVGGHPAFNVPLAEGTSYTDYRLEFSKKETAGRWPISKEGLIEKTPQPLLQESKELPLAKELFAKDAVVFKHLQSGSVQLLSNKTPHGLQFSFAGFPFLGLWAAPGANFLCIEPWCGIADSVDADGELANKEGINRLAAGERFAVEWSVNFF
ncbi:MAG TPA: aldose 1-epimerase family protein [Flavisolibacter sp.]|jgi:galactose mutarotase-like enzyme|nr:aldose 1-epimerase family protein [Flavisolibacter sp.]